MSDSPLPSAASLSDALRRTREKARSGRTCLVHAAPGGQVRETTYRVMRERLARLGGLFTRWGLSPGNRVLIASSDDAAVLSLTIACLEYGLSAVVADPAAPAPEAEHVLATSRPEAACIDRALLSRWPLGSVERVLPVTEDRPAGGGLLGKLLRRKPDEAAEQAAFPGVLKTLEPAPPPSDVADSLEAYVLFTSGSTSRPKGVSISRGSLLAHASTLSRQLGYDSGCRLLDVLPLHHTDGLVHGGLTAWLNGGTSLRPMTFSITAAGNLLDSVYTLRATHFITVPTMLALLERCGGDYADAFRTEDFRFVISSAGNLDEHLWTRFEERFGSRVVNIYGLTETVVGGLFCGPDDETYRVGTVGKPVDCRARIVDGDGRDVPSGEQGQLLLSGHNLMSGYLNDPEGTAAVLRDGWFSTGDVCSADDDGFYRVVGRLKNIIITGGLNVHPEEVSEVLRGMPGVADAVAFGVEDGTFGEAVAACVVAEDNAAVTVEALIAGCRERLSPYKVPRLLALVPALPKGPSGKVVMPEVRELLAHSAAGEALAADAGGDVAFEVAAIAARVFLLPAEQLSSSSAPENTPGWDSFAHLALVAELERVFDVKLSTADVLAVRTLGDAVRAVRRTSAQ